MTLTPGIIARSQVKVVVTIDGIAAALPGELGRDIVRAVNTQMQTFQKTLGDAGEIGYHG